MHTHTTHTCTCTHTCTHTHTHAHTHTHMHMHTHTTHTRTHTHTHAHTRMHAHTRTHAHAHTHACKVGMMHESKGQHIGKACHTMHALALQFTGSMEHGSLGIRLLRIAFVFGIFTVQQWCLSSLLFTSVWPISAYISLLYTCSNLFTVNVIALNTVPPGTGEQVADKVAMRFINLI